MTDGCFTGHRMEPPVPHQGARAGRESFRLSASDVYLTILQYTIYLYDGGTDAAENFALSGEKGLPQLTWLFGPAPTAQRTAREIAVTNVAKREYQKSYMEYWNDSANLTGTGRPVDGFFSAVGPFPAAMPNKYIYSGNTMFVNVLDYSSITIPVTHADKAVDLVVPNYRPLSDEDKAVYENCE